MIPPNLNSSFDDILSDLNQASSRSPSGSPKKGSPKKDGYSPTKKLRDFNKEKESQVKARLNFDDAVETKIEAPLKKILQFDLLVDSKENAVEPHQYFFDATDVNLCRPKKFKDVSHSVKNNESLKEIKGMKKRYERECIEHSTAALKDSLINMCVAHARSENAIDKIALPSQIKIPNGLVEAYDELIFAIKKEKSKEPYVYPESLKEFVDFSTKEIQKVKDAIPNGNKDGKVDEKLWNLHREKLSQLLEIYWNTPFELDKETTTMKKLFIDLTSKGKLNKWNNLFNALKNEIEKKSFIIGLGEKTKRDLLFKVISPMIAFLYTEVENKIKYNTPSMQHFADFRKQCESKELNNYFDVATETIRNSQSNALCIKSLIKEQKQHSIARFYNLLNYYTAFSNTIHHLCSLAENKYNLERKDIITVLNKILENSHIKPNVEMTAEACEKLLSINPNLHRAKEIMGREKEKLSVENRNLSINNLNLFTNSWTSENSVVQYERSHTLPFPSCFAWNAEKTISYMKDVFTNSKTSIEGDEIYYNKHLFDQIVSEKVDHRELEELFLQEFEKSSNTHKNSDDFIFNAFKLVKFFYIRLFSETELLPDFVNQELDAISEFKDEVRDKAYKKTLATSLQEMISTGSLLSKTDVAKYLKPYFEKTAEQLLLARDRYRPSRGNLFSVANLLKMTCLYQIEEAMRVALYDGATTATVDEIFKTKKLPISELL